jgi:hypothetical protein
MLTVYNDGLFENHLIFIQLLNKLHINQSWLLLIIIKY